MKKKRRFSKPSNYKQARNNDHEKRWTGLVSLLHQVYSKLRVLTILDRFAFLPTWFISMKSTLMESHTQMSKALRLTQKINEVKHTVKFQSKKLHVSGQQLQMLIKLKIKLGKISPCRSTNFLISLIKKGWQNVGILHIKTSMGKSIKIWG